MSIPLLHICIALSRQSSHSLLMRDSSAPYEIGACLRMRAERAPRSGTVMQSSLRELLTRCQHTHTPFNNLSTTQHQRCLSSPLATPCRAIHRHASLPSLSPLPSRTCSRCSKLRWLRTPRKHGCWERTPSSLRSRTRPCIQTRYVLAHLTAALSLGTHPPVNTVLTLGPRRPSWKGSLSALPSAQQTVPTYHS
jgi:hypothetical protein